jgi:tetratricopeptide (TPR) repeat protein
MAWVCYQCGRIKLSQNDIDAAAAYFQSVLDAPNHVPGVRAMAQERLGFVELFEKRDPAAALEHFHAAQKVATGDEPPGWLVQLNIRMSHAHLERREYDDALAAARSALRTIQSNGTTAHRMALPEAHLAIADVMAVMPDYESEAIEHYLRFLQYSRRPPGIDVTWSKVHETIGHLSFRLERYQQAITAFEKALEINPYHPWDLNLRYQIARCYYRSRLYERVVETITEIETRAQNDAEEVRDWLVHNLLGNALFALEDFQAASEAYQTALELAPVGDTGVEKTRIYLRFCEELLQSAEE